MHQCPKCNGTNIVMVEYAYNSKERYDGVSEYNCRDCGYRQGRWTEQEIPEGYCESRYGERGVVEAKDYDAK